MLSKRSLISILVLIAFVVESWVAATLIDGSSLSAMVDTSALPLLGEETSATVLLGILLALSLGTIVAVGVGLTFGTKMLAGIITKTNTNETFAAKAAANQAREKDAVKKGKIAFPVDPIPAHDRPGVDEWMAAALIGLLSAFLGVAMGATFVENPVFWQWGAVFAVVGFVLGLLVLRGKSTAIEATSKDDVPWNGMMVVLSGALFLGLGIGLMLILMAPQ